MFGELFDTIKTVFLLMVIIVAIIIVVAVINGVKESREAEERNRQEQQRRRDDINRKKIASKRWSKEYKNVFLTKVWNEYRRLLECQKKPIGQGYASKTTIMVNIDGELPLVSMDAQGLYEIYCYIAETVRE